MVRAARQRRGIRRELERAAGFEPATTGLEGQRYYQLSYARSGCPVLAPLKGAKAVAVRADDIALGHLGKDALDASATDEGRDPGNFRRWISVIEVHRALRELPTTVRTRNRPKFIEN
jgi:hypothetical protein